MSLILGGEVLFMAAALCIGAIFGHTLARLLYPYEPAMLKYPDLRLVVGMVFLGLTLMAFGLL